MKAMAATGFSSSYFQPTFATSGSITSVRAEHQLACTVADLTYTSPRRANRPLFSTTVAWVVKLVLEDDRLHRPGGDVGATAAPMPRRTPPAGWLSRRRWRPGQSVTAKTSARTMFLIEVLLCRVVSTVPLNRPRTPLTCDGSASDDAGRIG